MTDPDPRRRAEHLTAIGVPDDVVTVLAPGAGQVSARSLLQLYRSAQPSTMADLGRHLPRAGQRPGLVLLATEDHGSGTEAMRRRAAARAGARIEVLPELGHWWMLQDPHRAAALLHRFWTTLPEPTHPPQQPQ